MLEFEKFLKPLDPAPKECDVSNYNPSSYVPERPYWSYGYRPYYSRYWDWDYPYYRRWWDYPYRYSSYYPYWRSPYYYDRYRYYPYSSYYSSYDAYLDAKYGTYTAPTRYVYTPTYYESPVRTEVVYSSPVRKEVVYSSYSPVSTAYTYSSPVRTVYSSPYRSYYY